MQKLKPDLPFIKEVITNGGEDLKKCFQCATCTSVCTLSEEDNPFPRKQMAFIQWGLKNEVITDKNLWLCHQCGDCTTYCPRGAKPANVLASARRSTIMHYAVPQQLTFFFKNKFYLPILLIAPAIIIALFLKIIGHLHIPKGDVRYAEFFPHLWLNIFFTALFAGAIYFMVKSATNFWKDIDSSSGKSANRGNYICAGFETVNEIFTHIKFKKCDTNKERYLGHLGIFWGFAILLVVTSIAVILVFLGKYPLAFFHPVKMLGNIGAVALLWGCWIIWKKRKETNKDDLESTYFDWYFFGILASVGVTGVLTELLRFMNIAILAYPVYFIHLVLVFNLLIFLPFSKFAHVVYRSIAIFHGKLRKPKPTK
jgi:quinone-modifying oxidoreductase, subunit QmoC